MLVRADEKRFHWCRVFAANDDFQFGAQAGLRLFNVAVYDVLDGNEDNPRITFARTLACPYKHCNLAM